ncbi:MAG: BBE domain-containing protein [Thermoleophilaceae bacterium]|nr:BBE domain-containing protein [Thermoleophilaceae bacterium]
MTELTFGLVPVDMPFTHATYRFPWSAVTDVLAAWQEWMSACPPDSWTVVELETQAPGAGALPEAVVEVSYAGTPTELEPIVAGLIDAAGVAPEHRTVECGPFLDVEKDFFCRGLRRKECGLGGKSAAGGVPRPAFYAKTDVAKAPWPAACLDTLVEWMERRQRDRTLTPERFDLGHTVGKVFLEPAGGAVNATAPDATAFVHRDNLFSAQFQSRWRGGSSQEVVDANLEWLRGLYTALAPWRSGSAYQNYIDPDLENWQEAYYGTNLPRLREVKAAYDPGELFKFPQSIPPG